MTDTVVRTTRNRSLLDEWSLVLSAADIRHRKRGTGGQYSLSVDPAQAADAVAALSDYDLERRRRRRAPWPLADRSSNVAWAVASAILLGQMWLDTDSPTAVAYASGANRAAALFAGEWWRPITALTLHADGLHAMSNAASALLFLSPLCRSLGGGTAFTLALLGGALGNLANAAIRGGDYSGIGASTAIFAAVGLLAGTRLTADEAEPVWRRWRSLGAALAILAMLGASPETDVPAHLLGLVSGTAIGVAFVRIARRPLDPFADACVGIAGLVVLAASWAAALYAS